MSGRKNNDDEAQKPKPKTRTEPERGGSGRPPRRTAVGSGGGDDLPRYKPGQVVLCRVVSEEPGGYAVSVLTPPGNLMDRRKTTPNADLPGFLATQAILKPAEEIMAKFVCHFRNRILLSTTFSSKSAGGQKDSPETIAFATSDLDEPSGQQLQSQVERNQARPHRLQRATDLFPPPVSASDVAVVNTAKGRLDRMIADIESDFYTGVVRASSEDRLSRAAMLVYQGRVVGCIYGNKNSPETPPTEEALRLMLIEMCLPDTKISMYPLPDPTVLGMSALFLGYPVQPDHESDAQSYLDYLLGWFESKQQTACLAIVLPGDAATCLAFVHEGRFDRAFHVEDREFSRTTEFVHALLKSDPGAIIEASILPSLMLSPDLRFGFRMSHHM